MNHTTLALGNVLQDTQELGKGQVRDLTTPHFDHPLEVQVLKDQNGEVISQLVGQLKEVVSALIRNPFMRPSQGVLGPVSGFGTALLPAQDAVEFADPVQVLLEEKRGWLAGCLRPIVNGQKILQPKVETGDSTRPGFRAWDGQLTRKAQIQPIQLVSLDGDRLDLALWQTIIDQLVHTPIELDLALRDPLPARLLEGVALELGHLTKRWRGGLDTVFQVAKEQLVALVDAFNDSLQGLRRDRLEPSIGGQFLELGEVLHQGVLVQVLARQLVVSLVQGYGVVVGSTSKVDGPVYCLETSTVKEYQHIATTFKVKKRLDYIILI